MFLSEKLSSDAMITRQLDMIITDTEIHNRNPKIEETSICSGDLYFSFSSLSLFVNTLQDNVSPQYNAVLSTDLQTGGRHAHSFVQ